MDHHFALRYRSKWSYQTKSTSIQKQNNLFQIFRVLSSHIFSSFWFDSKFWVWNWKVFFLFFWTSFLFAAKSTSYQKLFRQPWYLVRVHDTISYISKVVHFACLHVFNICVFTARQEVVLLPSVKNTYINANAIHIRG